ncbi:galactonate dehydratase [Actinomadura alba]|uniref:Galactonate dehydratase n=1 Tax=Actinomadura alba TaxID=406431 RepID=A0ABR7LPQ8_9ACTN|nr:galactonate dehydratase [Actinomadura alba]MBC6466725.1 galactonate dehydratase [Actinomadura alba]
MKVTRVETFLAPPRWLFCRVETDEGHVGWGEPVVEGRAHTVRAAVNELAELLIGADPLRIEDHWQVMTKGGFYRGGPVFASAVAGLDQALWDIAGKARGAPVHELLGGPVRDHVRAYAWIGGDEPREIREQAQRQAEAGFSAVKMNASGRMSPLAGPSEIHAVVERVATAREVLGPDRDVAVDFHGRVSYPNARRLLPLLEPLTPLFVEEPVVPESMAQMRSLVEASSVPIALGERLYSRWDFMPALQAGIAVVQPDLSHAGGISEVRRIAAQAEVFGALLAPHCPLGPIALAASLQVVFATPNFLIQEQSIGLHYNGGNELLDYLVDPAVFAMSDGRFTRPTGPGLGITVDEAKVREVDRAGHTWRSPIWRYPDQSFAEW